MKKSNVRAIANEEEEGFNAAFINLEKTILADAPVSPKDKKGGKASDAEIDKMAFISQNISKIENYLPRSFKEDEFFQRGLNIKTKTAQIAQLERLKAVLTNQIIVERIEIKSAFSEVYDAAKKATAADATLNYIKNAIAELYERDSTKLDDANGNKPSDSAK